MLPRHANPSITALARIASRRSASSSPLCSGGAPSSRSLTTSTATTPSPRPTSRASTSRTFLTLATGVIIGSAIALTLPRPRLLSIILPNPTPSPHPSDSKEGRAETTRLENELQNLSLVKQLRSEKIPIAETSQSSSSSTSSAQNTSSLDGLLPKYRESRPYASTPAGPHSLSGYTLRGPSKFALPPLVFTTQDNKQSIFFMHLGRGLCGHEGIVHGGLLATVLDESLAWTALQSLPTNIGVTATLTMSYRRPTFADQFVVLRTTLTKQEGRKAWVEGHIEDLEGNVLVKAEGLFVEPKMAKFLSNSSVREVLK